MATLTFNPEIAAFLDLIAASEGTCSHPLTRADGYDVIATGEDSFNTFQDFSCHPFAFGRHPIIVKKGKPNLLSTASGRYQLTYDTWRHCAEVCHLGTFSPQNQDLSAHLLLDECHASEMIRAGSIDLAIYAANETWASFPGTLFHQGCREIEWLLSTYTKLLSAQGI